MSPKRPANENDPKSTLRRILLRLTMVVRIEGNGAHPATREDRENLRHLQRDLDAERDTITFTFCDHMTKRFDRFIALDLAEGPHWRVFKVDFMATFNDLFLHLKYYLDRRFGTPDEERPPKRRTLPSAHVAPPPTSAGDNVGTSASHAAVAGTSAAHVAAASTLIDLSEDNPILPPQAPPPPAAPVVHPPPALPLALPPLNDEPPLPAPAAVVPQPPVRRAAAAASGGIKVHVEQLKKKESCDEAAAESDEEVEEDKDDDEPWDKDDDDDDDFDPNDNDDDFVPP